jgi:hypothetical protein
MQFRLAKATVKVEVAFAFDDATPSAIYRNNTTRTSKQAIGAKPSDFLHVRLLKSPPAPIILWDLKPEECVTLSSGNGAFTYLLITPITFCLRVLLPRWASTRKRWRGARPEYFLRPGALSKVTA